MQLSRQIHWYSLVSLGDTDTHNLAQQYMGVSQARKLMKNENYHRIYSAVVCELMDWWIGLQIASYIVLFGKMFQFGRLAKSLTYELLIVLECPQYPIQHKNMLNHTNRLNHIIMLSPTNRYYR